MTATTIPEAAQVRARPLLRSRIGRILLAAFLALHALPHLMGVAVNVDPPTEAECVDSALSGCDAVFSHPAWVSPLLVVAWVAGAVAFLVVAVGVLTQRAWAQRVLLAVSAASAVLCAAELPGARVGLAVNLALLVWLGVRAVASRRRQP